MLVRRAGPPLLGLLLAWLQTGCTRASIASLLPTLEVGVLAQQRGRALDGMEQEQRWSAAAFVALNFRPVRPASELPLRAELAPETWIAPCNEDDVECLQEASGAEREVADALGELQ
jgi:hypothetical protein